MRFVVDAIMKSDILRHVDEAVVPKLVGAMVSVSQWVVNSAKERLKWAIYTFDKAGRVVSVSGGGRATGMLANSLAFEVVSSKRAIISTIGTNLEYGKYVEFGTRSHFVPFSVAPQLMLWAKRHGFNVMKRGGMKVSGRAIPFLRPALDKNKERIRRKFEGLVI
ncbi:MAG: hypothetical protein ABIK73_06710 [candidate division WOR-3 bacterium]